MRLPMAGPHQVRRSKVDSLHDERDPTRRSVVIIDAECVSQKETSFVN